MSGQLPRRKRIAICHNQFRFGERLSVSSRLGPEKVIERLALLARHKRQIALFEKLDPIFVVSAVGVLAFIGILSALLLPSRRVPPCNGNRRSDLRRDRRHDTAEAESQVRGIPIA